MSSDEDKFEVRTGRIRSGSGGRRAKSYLSRISRSVSKAGPGGRTRRYPPSFSNAANGRRRVIVKTRIIKLTASSAGALAAHLAYIRRDSALSASDKGKLFGPDTDAADERSFGENVSSDRHHFRFIVSPEDGALMTDLKPFVRDVMRQMETDLETRLDWVAAVHTDTGKPHAHIVLRGRGSDGRDLVIPKAYVSHTMRERAEDLVTLELGPETRLEADRKLASEVQSERLTRIDRYLTGRANDGGEVSLSESGKYRAVHAARLKKLSALGLAQRVSSTKWQLAPDFTSTLNSLGERGDIIKTIHKALANHGGRQLDGASIFDRTDPNAKSVIGAVIATGATGEAHDTAYAVLDTLQGQSVYVEIGDIGQSEKLGTGWVVEVSPPNIQPKGSDRTIAKIALANNGIYSAGLHQAADPSAGAEFITAHVRRLEALRRSGYVTRTNEGDWRVSPGHLARVSEYEQKQALLRPVNVTVLSRLSVQQQTKAIGVTWLDERRAGEGGGLGFANDVAEASIDRRRFLVEQGVLASKTDKLTVEQKSELRRRDLAIAADDLSSELAKSYTEAPINGEIAGKYIRSINRPSGKFAVVERGKDFTLVPWRDVLERNHGKSIMGIVREGQITWRLSKNRSLGIR